MYIPDDDPFKTYLGEKQWKWLNNSMKEEADVRILVSSIQVIADGHGYEKWGNLPIEKIRLFNLIDKNNINYIIILSVDRHRAGIFTVTNASKKKNIIAPIFSQTVFSI